MTNTAPAEDDGKTDDASIFSAAGSKRRAGDSDSVFMDAKETDVAPAKIALTGAAADQYEGRALSNMMRFMGGSDDDGKSTESAFDGMMMAPPDSKAAAMEVEQRVRASEASAGLGLKRTRERGSGVEAHP